MAREANRTGLRKGHLKGQAEGLLLYAQTQSLRTNVIKANVDRIEESILCRIDVHELR